MLTIKPIMITGTALARASALLPMCFTIALVGALSIFDKAPEPKMNNKMNNRNTVFTLINSVIQVGNGCIPALSRNHEQQKDHRMNNRLTLSKGFKAFRTIKNLSKRLKSMIKSTGGDHYLFNGRLHRLNAYTGVV